MPFPYLVSPQLLPDGTAHELDSILALLNAFLAKQHNADGSHGAITCDSLSSAGAVTGQTITGTSIVIHGPVNAATGPGSVNVAGRVTGSQIVSAGGVYERARGFAMGDWNDVPFNAGDFTGSGSMIWTVTAGNIVTRRYTLVGHTMSYACFIQSTTVGGTPSNELHVALPAPYTVAHHAITGGCVTQDVGGPLGIGYTQIVAGTNYVLVTRPGNVNFSVGSGTAVYFTATLEVA